MKVELEIKFNIGDKVKRYSNGEICIVKDIFVNVDERNIKHIHYHIVNEQNKTDLCLSGCLLEKASILDKQEHDYLRAVCKPFKVVSICKNETRSGDEWITIYTKSRVYFGSIASWLLPVFTKDTMYKGMEVDKEYTIEELELDKEWNNGQICH